MIKCYTYSYPIQSITYILHIYIFLPNTSGDGRARASLCRTQRRMGVRSACMSIFLALCSEWEIFKRKLIFLSPKMPFTARNTFTRSHIYGTGNALPTQCVSIFVFGEYPFCLAVFEKHTQTCRRCKLENVYARVPYLCFITVPE